MASIRTTADQIRSLKATLPKGTPDNVIIIQNGRQPHLYMCTTCHAWRCECDVPRTVRRYAINKNHRDPLHLEATVYEGGFVVPHAAKKAWSAEPEANEKKKMLRKKSVLLDLSNGPITARHPFRVSTAHWASRSHTQQWPFKGGLQCKLLSQDGQPHHNWSRHTNCWTHAAKHKH